MPDYLYHYTNLSALALILKNRTIRLNSLKNMDDAEEIVTANSPFLGKYCFVSSWTDLSEESVPFWGLYTENMTGVRLKMQKEPFIKFRHQKDYYDDGNPFDSYCPSGLIDDYPLYLIPTLPFLRKVVYTEDENLIFPSPFTMVERNPDGTYDIIGNMNDLNLHKRSCWEFQNEWRYGLLFLPHDEHGRLKMDLETAESNDMPFWFCDLPIREDAFNDIEIMTGPKMSDGDKVLLHCLVEKYCPSARIVSSTLKVN